MIDLSPKLMLQVMNDCARGRDCLRHVRATKTVQLFNLKMLAQREARVLGQKGIAVILDRVIDFA